MELKGKTESAENTPSSVTEEKLTELAILLFEHMEHQVHRTDVKAQLIMAADALLVSVITFSGKGVAVNLLDNTISVANRVAILLTLLMLVSLLLSVYFALMVIRPTFWRPQPRQALFFFGYIARCTEQEFKAKFLSQQLHEISDSFLGQIYDVAQLTDRKFAGIRKSLDCLMAVLLLWALSQALLALTP